MEDKVKKYCGFCGKKYSAKNNFCPVCGKELKIMNKVDFKKLFGPYLKGTGFTIEEYRDGSGRFGWYRGDNISKDSQTIVKRFIKNKPDFFTTTVKVYYNFKELEFSIDLQGKDAPFNGYLYLPVNKINISLVLCLVNRENAVKLVDTCQQQIESREKQLKEGTAILKRYKDLRKRLSLKEEE